MDLTALPRPFAMAISQSRAAMACYDQLPPAHRDAVLRQVSQARTKRELQTVVHRLAHWPAPQTAETTCKSALSVPYWMQETIP